MIEILNNNTNTMYLKQILSHLDLILPKFIFSIILFLLFLIVGSLGKRIIFKLSMKNTSKNIHVYELLGRAFKIVIIAIGIISALGTLGVHVGALIGGLGLTGFALGFAMKDIFANILAGILILLYRPIKLGYYMEIDGFNGNISNIDFRYTSLENDGKTILIPNSKVFSSIICINKQA